MNIADLSPLDPEHMAVGHGRIIALRPVEARKPEKDVDDAHLFIDDVPTVRHHQPQRQPGGCAGVACHVQGSGGRAALEARTRNPEGNHDARVLEPVEVRISRGLDYFS